MQDFTVDTAKHFIPVTEEACTSHIVKAANRPAVCSLSLSAIMEERDILPYFIHGRDKILSPKCVSRGDAALLFTHSCGWQSGYGAIEITW